MLKKLSVFLGVMIIMVALCAIQVFAAGPSTPPAAGTLAAVNNLTGTLDTVTISSGLTAGDIVKVYSTATGGVPNGVTVAAGSSATIYIGQLGATGGNAHVSVTSSGFDESARTPVTYTAETQTAAPAPISTQNKVVGNPDIISVSGISSGDIVRVYSSSVGMTLIGATVSAGTSSSVYVNQLGLAPGNVYVSAQSTGKLESARIAMSYLSETSAVPAGVTFINNLSPATDKVTVPSVAVGDIITIYPASTGPSTVVTLPLTLSEIDGAGATIIDVPQLGVTSGKIYVTITNNGKAESKRAVFTYPAEPVTLPPSGMKIVVTNNYTGTDTVNVTGLVASTTVKIYTTSSSTASVDIGTASASGVASISLTTALPPLTGTIYVTLTLPSGANEGAKIAVNYGKPKAADAPLLSNITVFNDINLNPDTVTVSGLGTNDVIKIYDTAISTAPIDAVTADTPTELMTLTKPLKPSGGSIYVTLTTTTAGESARTKVLYAKEYAAPKPLATNITVLNNCKPTADTVSMTGLTAGDVISIYETATSTTAIGTATAANPIATLNKDLLTGGGTIYVTLTTTAAGESDRTLMPYAKEAASNQPAKENITVTNRFDKEDIVIVTGITSGDTVNVYNSLTGMVPLNILPGIEVNGTATIMIPAGKLLPVGGRIYVASSSTGSNESTRTLFTYTSEKSTVPTVKTVQVVNNYIGTADTVTVSGVAAGDIVTIYKTMIGSDTWNTPTALLSTDIANGAATFSIDQLGSTAGKIYITLTQVDKAQSMRATIAYTSEQLTTAPVASNIAVANNHDAEDTVTVSNLTAGQIVSVYTTAIAAAAVDSIIVPGTPGDTGITVTLTLDDGILTAAGGKVYVTLKADNALASTRTACAYSSDITMAPKASNILVINYAGAANDTVTIIGLTAGDTVTIYDAAIGGGVLATETVLEKGTTLMLTTNLKVISSKIYVTVTSVGKVESKRVAVAYAAE